MEKTSHLDDFWVLDNHKQQKANIVNKRGIISTEMVNKALSIVFDLHKEQTDIAGRPYLLRIFHVAEQMQGEVPVCASLLSDAVESGQIAYEELSAEDFPDEVMEIVTILKHDPTIPYMQYIQNIRRSGNLIAANIMRMRLLYDIDMSMFGDVDDEVIASYYRHLEAMAVLERDNDKSRWRDKNAQYIYEAIKTRSIDIKSGAPSIGGRLSNLSRRSFGFEGIECASIEGVLQSFKFRDPMQQMSICKLYGAQAKKAGNRPDWKTSQTLYWKDMSFSRESPEYQQLLDALYRAAFEQNERLREDLRLSKGYILLHAAGIDNPKETVLTRYEFLSRLERLRNQEDGDA